MKSYMKPVFEYIVLTVEERFALGSGTACTVWGTCASVGIKQLLIDGVWTPINFGD